MSEFSQVVREGRGAKAAPTFDDDTELPGITPNVDATFDFVAADFRWEGGLFCGGGLFVGGLFCGGGDLSPSTPALSTVNMFFARDFTMNAPSRECPPGARPGPRCGGTGAEIAMFAHLDDVAYRLPGMFPPDDEIFDMPHVFPKISR